MYGSIFPVDGGIAPVLECISPVDAVIATILECIFPVDGGIASVLECIFPVDGDTPPVVRGVIESVRKGESSLTDGTPLEFSSV